MAHLFVPRKPQKWVTTYIPGYILCMAMFCYGTSATCLVRVPCVTRRMSFLLSGGLFDYRWRGAIWQWRGVVRRMHVSRHMHGTVLHCLLRWRGVARRLWRGVVWRLYLFRRWRGVVLQWLLRWRGEVRRQWRGVLW